MGTTEITFDTMPRAIEQLFAEVGEIKQLLSAQQTPTPALRVPVEIDQACEILYKATPTHKTQLQTIFLYLQDHVATASMVAAATGVPQKCITRYKRDLERNRMLWEVERKYCKLTGFKAYYLTTDPTKVPNNPQLKLSLIWK